MVVGKLWSLLSVLLKRGRSERRKREGGGVEVLYIYAKEVGRPRRKYCSPRYKAAADITFELYCVRKERQWEV